MGEKDIGEKVLADYADVFADIVNVLLFDGERTVQPETLVTATTRSMYKADRKKLHETERDVAKYWTEGNVRLALFGLENQTIPEKLFPLRVIGYDGQNYRSQLSRRRNTKKAKKQPEFNVFPVITLVLYFGTKHWNNATRLTECFDVPEKLKPFVNDYKINLVEVAFLSDEKLALFQSDFKIVADYFVQKRKNKDYKPSPQVIEHVDEVLKLLSVLTGDDRFEMAQTQSGERSETMSEVLDKVERRGIQQGLERGLERGRKLGLERGLVNQVRIMKELQTPVEVAFRLITQSKDYSNVTREQIEKLYKK